MKVATLERKVSVNTLQSSEFTIRANGKAFKALVDGLYAKKHESITREIWSNAYDAHCEVGKADVPFDVTLPTWLDPSFRVRDYGSGLSHEDVMTLYTTVFESSKEDTNSQVGKFGLGSKSPFSYTDSFSVTSWFGGEKRFYSAVINEEGIPTINLMGVEQTAEPNGLEVSFPVHPDDMGKFERAIQRVGLGFDVKPNLIGSGSDFEWNTLEVIVEGGGYKFFRSTSDGLSTGWYAKMGCVIYPIDVSIIPNHRQRYGTSVLLDFEVGELEVTVSREALSYGKNEPTTDNILKRIEEVKAAAQRDAQKQVNECSSWAEAYAKVGDITSNVAWVKASDLTYNGADILSGYEVGDALEVSYESNYSLRNTTSRRWNRARTVFSRDSVIFIESREAKKRDVRAAMRINNYLSEKGLKAYNGPDILWVRYHNKGKGEAQELSRLLEAFSSHPVVMVADIPDPGPTTSSTNREVKIKKLIGRYYGYRNWNGSYSMWEETEVDLEKGGYYVQISNNEYESGDPWWSYTLMKQMKMFPDVPIYVVPKTHWKKFEGHAKWKDFSPVMRRWKKAIKPQLERLVSMGHALSALPVWSTDLKGFTGLQRIRGQVTKDFKGIRPDAALEVGKNLKIFNYSFKPDEKYRRKVDLLVKQCYKKYPLLRYYTNGAVVEFQDYVNMVNERNMA